MCGWPTWSVHPSSYPSSYSPSSIHPCPSILVLLQFHLGKCICLPTSLSKLSASLAYTSTAAILPHRLSSLAGDASRGCQDARVPCMAGPDREGGWTAPSGVIAVASDTGPCLGPCGNPATVSIYGQIRLVTATSLQPLL